MFTLSGGLEYSYYEGSWDSLPDFSKLKPVATGIADSTVSIQKLPAKTSFACLLEGYIEIALDLVHMAPDAKPGNPG